MEIDNKVHAASRHEWRKWLESNAETEKYCWLVLPRKQSEFTYIDAVEEALCFGWIDSTKKGLDEQYIAQRFSHRVPKSNWTELNKERARRMKKLGLMTVHGERVLPDLDAEFEMLEEISEAINEDTALAANFAELPDLYVRIKLDNIQSVRKDRELFDKRLATFLEKTRKGELYGKWNDEGRLIDDK
ncbi:YdeI/OmpD-associated family protein [Listeria grandensis]|uniref:YdeI/OmpD-associated family protein n=1 Tax=Listeria grandensis TaxID=1494963 RepID=UPI00164EB5CE|nr:YdeI/OmpD-associated family protein [Listeria grandensis]MBC6315741.1 thymidylate synthase [Listeria grandensis]